MQDKSLSTKGLKIAAFDWDNTLAGSREALVYSINQVLPQYGLPDWEVVKNKRDRSLSFKDNFPLIFGKDAEEAYAKYSSIYKKNVRRLIKLPKGTLDVLQFLKRKKVKIVIVSNKDRELFEFESPFLYNEKIFTRIVCGHEAQRDKPYPEQLEFATLGLVDEITPQKVWMIGDSPMDSKCALAAGAKAIRIGRPIWGTADDEESADIIYVDDFQQLYNLLLEQN